MATYTKTSTGGTFDSGYFHAQVYVTTSDSSTYTTVTVKCNAVSYGGSSSFIYGKASNTSSGAYGSESSATSVSANTTVTIKTESFTVNRTTSNQTITCKAYLRGGGTGMYNGDYDEATVSVTIPALEHWTIAYNGNKPAAATGSVNNVPSSQTKYYNTTLTLSSTTPSLTGYNFIKWNTASAGTGTSYTPGASYTTNAAATLYGIWQLGYVEPIINNVKAIRSDSSGNALDTGTYALITASWSVDSSADNGANTVDSCTWRYKTISESNYSVSWATITISGTSGTLSTAVGGSFDEDQSYNIQIKITDTHGGSTVKEVILPPGFKTIDFLNGGTGVSIGKSATTTSLFDVALNTRIDNKNLYIKSNNITSNTTVTTSTYGRYMYFKDSNDKNIGFIDPSFSTSGSQGIRFYTVRAIGSTTYYNGFTLWVNSTGSPTVSFYNSDCKRAWLTALTPDVLYNNTTGTDGTVTLSSSAAGYDHMTIYFKHSDVAVYGSVDLYQPDGKNANLFLGGTGNDNGYFWPLGRDVTVSGTSIITRATNRYYYPSSVSSSSITTGKTNKIKIVRVEAW